MSKEVLQNIIDDFSVDKFQLFFRRKSNKFRFPNEPIYEESENFTDGLKIAEAKFEDGKLIVCAFLSKQDLSERSGKKSQYEIGKKILRHTETDAGIFIFYDIQGSFRFSLIYANYLGRRRDWSNYRRFTYFVSKELTNKTFLQRIGEGDFSTIDRIKDAFNVEKVTKEFYQEIANWYFWAIRESKFPPDAEAEDNGRNIAVIRLITRMIFIWFMKVRHLIPEDLFKEDKIRDILNDISSNKSTYYKAILQNLFFATLNTRQENRKFRSDVRGYKGYNPDFGNHNVYRYHKLFKAPEKMQEYFENIPFLNGGLFECLDYKSKRREERYYIDGFTDTQKNQPYVPNYLFFSGEKEIDLNDEYGTRSRKYRVRGLINILSSYNFTIDENEPDDLEVALDPELLGRVFENLLASYNPETATTARKATGSYYTPREIVDYMVTQSLKYYFKTYLSDVSDIEEKLSQLFSKENYNNPFDSLTTKKLISLIESLRVVDPAVGSGAFPMGVLSKLVFILSKLDPQNILWKEAQIEAIKRDVKDPILKEKLIQQAEEYFKNKDINYLRKLYLIEKCIYGVDIQQIAVEIAKLRFFISLLVDEKIDKTKPNWGIESLPNLDFKLMQGNSLISSFAGIDFEKKKESKDKGQLSLGFTSKYDDLIKEFEEIKHQYQNEPDKDKKDKLREKIEELILQIFEEKLKEYLPEFRKIEERASNIPNSKHRQDYISAEKQRLAKKYGFDFEQAQKDLIAYTEGRKPKNFFLWDVYFAEVFTGDNPGFDIVIANPPYGFRNILTADEKRYFRKKENIEFKSGDSAELFCKKSFADLAKENGILTFIIPKKSLYGDAWENLRIEYWNKYDLIFLLDSSKAFENVLLEQSAFGLSKREQAGKVKLAYLNNDEIINFAEEYKDKIFMNNGTVQIYKELYPNIFEKIKKSKTSEILVQGDLGLAIGTDFFSDKPTEYKLLKGIDIDRWRIKQIRYLKNKDKLKDKELNKFLRPKVICQRLIAHIENPEPHIKITACYDNEGIIITNTLTAFKLDKRINEKFWLAYLNSGFVNWYTYNFIYSRAIRTMDFYSFYIQQIPIPKAVIKDRNKQKPFIDIVEKILSLTQSEDYLQNPQKQAKVKEYEHQIDQLVYKLYGLTEEEIKIVENFAASK